MIRHASNRVPWVVKTNRPATASTTKAALLAPAASPLARALEHDASSAVAPLDAPVRGNERADEAETDWDTLFGAVKDRLRETAITGPALECVQALDQLQSTLCLEVERRQQLELNLFDTQTALAQARTELAGTRAGERRAQHLALHDSLTSLPNRRCFGERLNQALGVASLQCRALAVLYLDLDGFKPVNDTHGHAVGDELLRVIAVRLNRVVRSDDTVSRVGGDEFACVLLNLANRLQVSQLARKIFGAVAAPCVIGSHQFTVRPSIGIAICPLDGTTAEPLIRRADTAMYRARRDRIGHAFFDPARDA